MDVKMTSMEESFTEYPRHPRAYVQTPSVSHGCSNAPHLSTSSAHTHLRNLIIIRRSALTIQYECMQYRQYVWRKKMGPIQGNSRMSDDCSVPGALSGH